MHGTLYEHWHKMFEILTIYTCQTPTWATPQYPIYEQTQLCLFT